VPARLWAHRRRTRFSRRGLAFPGPGLAALEVSPENPKAASWTVTIKLAAPPPAGAVVRVLYRHFRSNQGDWTAIDAQGSGTTYRATLGGSGEGAMFAAEVDAGPGQAWRYPDVTRETPYRSLAP
jgi:hypothetical protein